MCGGRGVSGESGKEAAGAAARAGQKPHGSAPWPGLSSSGRGHFLHGLPLWVPGQ